MPGQARGRAACSVDHVHVGVATVARREGDLRSVRGEVRPVLVRRARGERQGALPSRSVIKVAGVDECECVVGDGEFTQEQGLLGGDARRRRSERDDEQCQGGEAVGAGAMRLSISGTRGLYTGLRRRS